MTTSKKQHLGSTQKEILGVLSLTQFQTGATVVQMADWIGITTRAARHGLARLFKAGLVGRNTPRNGKGRVEHVYFKLDAVEVASKPDDVPQLGMNEDTFHDSTR